MKRILIILAVVSVFTVAGLAYAEDPGMMGGGPGMEQGMMGGEHHMLWRTLMGLGLDEKQKEAVKEIRDKTMKETIKKRADLEIARIDLRDLLDKEQVDMNAVEAKLKTIESLETDIRLSHIKAFEEIKATLTPDQRKKFRQMMEESFMMRGKGMKRRCGGMMGGMMQQKGMEMTPPADESEEQPEM